MRTPIHLWIVGIVALLWNAGGAFDYFMTQTRNATYLEMLTSEQLAYITQAPAWFDATWATGVWGAVAGSLLILLRSRFASIAFLASFVGMAASAVYSYVLASPSAYELGGMFGAIFSLAIAASLLLLLAYSRAMTRKGVLR